MPYSLARGQTDSREIGKCRSTSRSRLFDSRPPASYEFLEPNADANRLQIVEQREQRTCVRGHQTLHAQPPATIHTPPSRARYSPTRRNRDHNACATTMIRRNRAPRHSIFPRFRTTRCFTSAGPGRDAARTTRHDRKSRGARSRATSGAPRQERTPPAHRSHHVREAVHSR